MRNIWVAALLMAAASTQVLAQGALTTGCIGELPFEPRLAALAGKVALVSTGETTRAMLAIDRVADANERPALGLWLHLRQQCFEFGATHDRDISAPHRAEGAALLFAAHQGLLADLQAGRLTFAQFNRQRLWLNEARPQLAQAGI
jgi:hypothetical protein